MLSNDDIEAIFPDIRRMHVCVNHLLYVGYARPISKALESCWVFSPLAMSVRSFRWWLATMLGSAGCTSTRRPRFCRVSVKNAPSRDGGTAPHAVVEHRSRKDQPVQQSHRDAHMDPALRWWKTLSAPEIPAETALPSHG